MITQDDIDKIHKWKGRRYSQSRVAKKLGISISTVARYWNTKKEPDAAKPTPKRFDFDEVFVRGKCQKCGLAYPMPKFLPGFNCPRCGHFMQWKKCRYDQDSSTAKNKT